MNTIKSKKYIIGISAYYHDSAACLFENDNLVFACEQEKFSGIKHDSNYPFDVLDYMFEKFDIKKDEIEAVCYYENPQLKLRRVRKNSRHQFFKNLMFSIKSDLKTRRTMDVLKYNLENRCPNVFYSTHHESHLYYAYYTSPFKNAMCLSVDGVGELDTIAIGEPNRSGTLNYETVAIYPHSLGLYYAAMTSFLGFKPNEGEYKVMGLASYGNPVYFRHIVKDLIYFERGELHCNMDVFIWNRSDKTMFNEKLCHLLKMQNRLPDEEIRSDHKDLAAAVQERYEEILFDIISLIDPVDFDPVYPKNLCLGGGCAYNGKANGKILSKFKFDHLWIPPAPSDAGSCIGACIHYLAENGRMKNKISPNPFLGPCFNNKEIREEITHTVEKWYKSPSQDALIKDVAQALFEGKVVGWFRGHMEFGARALGNRSILANPLLGDVKDRINKVIKRREGFRPFAPMITKDRQFDYFEMTEDIPYMNQVVNVKPEYRSILKAVTHVDGTARVQTVYANTIMHSLLEEFEVLSGHPILLNTSFNLKDKTMVMLPLDAIEMFYETDMDLLIIENYVIYK